MGQALSVERQQAVSDNALDHLAIGAGTYGERRQAVSSNVLDHLAIGAGTNGETQEEVGGKALDHSAIEAAQLYGGKYDTIFAWLSALS